MYSNARTRTSGKKVLWPISCKSENLCEPMVAKNKGIVYGSRLVHEIKDKGR